MPGMATSVDFIEFVCDQLANVGDISYRKMFGEYCVYHNGHAVLLVCDDTVFVKQIPAAAAIFAAHNITPDVGLPYDGARPHYIMDVENRELAVDMVREMARVLPQPHKKQSHK